MHDMDFSTANLVIVERVVSHTHHHFLDSATFVVYSRVTIIYPSVLQKLLHVLIGQIG